MERYYFLRRVRGPLLLVTFGITAILNQWHVLSFGRSWPLYLIVLGILGLVERAAITAPVTSDVLPNPLQDTPPSVPPPPTHPGESR